MILEDIVPSLPTENLKIHSTTKNNIMPLQQTFEFIFSTLYVLKPFLNEDLEFG